MADQDYLAGVLEQTRNILSNRQYLDGRRNLFGDTLVAQVEGQFSRSAEADTDNLISIAFRVEQIAIRLQQLGESEIERQEARNAFETAAKLFEHIAEVQSIPSQRVLLDLYLHSAIDFSLGEFQANSVVLARKVFEIFEFDTDLHSSVLRAIFQLLRRNIAGLEVSVSGQVQDKQAFEASQHETIALAWTRNDAVEKIAHFISLEAILAFTRYLRLGQEDQYELARSKISNSLELFDVIKDPDNFVLTQLISLLFRQMHFSSLWHQLGTLHGFVENPILTRYLQILTTDKRHPIYELWRSQIQSIDKVLSNSSAVVLQMPTSAGKTRVAELKIIHTLAHSTGTARCIYIAPYKSLAAQVEESLDHYLANAGYRVTAVFGSYESIEFEDRLVEQSDVLVITPEKLDYLLRQNREFFDTVKLIVVDEGHLLDNDVRGLRLESLLERLRRVFASQGLQILFISAVIPNGKEIAAWLSQGEPVLADFGWKPTKLRQGMFYWGNDWHGKIRFPDEDLILNTQNIKRRVIQEFHKNNPKKRLKRPKYYPDTKYEIAVELALDFLKASPTIIFTAVRAHVNSIALNLYNRILEKKAADKDFHLAPNSLLELEQLARKVERRLGAEFPLAQYIREGFAYHHGQLPDDLRREIETVFRQECLPILIATPTLAQGVNLPVHLMIVANLRRGESNPFLVRDFRNIAGRAGRALNETEGQVIFIQKTQSRWVVQQMYRYFRDDQMERVESVLFKLYERLVQRKLNITLKEFLELQNDNITFEDGDLEPTEELDLAFQTQILALLYEGLLNESDPEGVRDALESTLFGTQCKSNQTYYEPLVRYTQKQARFVANEFSSSAQRQAYYQTGFSLRSCKALEEEVRRLLAEGVFLSLRDPSTGLLDIEVLTRILNLVSIPEETRTKYGGAVNLVEAIVRWINYADLRDFESQFGPIDKAFRNPLFISDLVYRHFMNDAPWSLNSVIKLLVYLRDEEGVSFDTEIGLLPGYVKFGVNTPVAAYVSGLGISDRNIARVIANHYFDQGNQALIPSAEDFPNWVESLTPDELLSILKDPSLVQEVVAVLRRYKPDSRPVDYFINPEAVDLQTYVVGLAYENRLKHLVGLEVGSSLNLIRETDNLFDPFAMAVHTKTGHKLGYIRRNWAFILASLYDENWRFNCHIERVFNISRRHPNRRLSVHISNPFLEDE